MNRVVYGFILPIAIVAVFAAIMGEVWQQGLRYQNDLFSLNQPWRLLTGHLLHLGWQHLLMNLLGLALVVLVSIERPLSQWWLESLICALGVSFGLYLFSPDIYWYVGLSGVLHGLFAAAIVGRWPQQPRLYSLLLVLLIGKLTFEQVSGGEALTGGLAHGDIVVDAHLYGAISGFIYSLFSRFALKSIFHRGGEWEE